MYSLRPESLSPSGPRSPEHRRSLDSSYADLQPQTSLPSIRHLQLPPPGMSQLSPSAPEPQPGAYTYPAPPHFVQQHDQGPPVGTLHPVAHSDDAFIADSEIEETEQPPKKKRRRQALSCTECKRRKIKCDRCQPCGPCSRRGEQAKCQWHIVEPIEKYVTRTEYDELRARVEQLEGIVHRLASSSSPYMPSSYMPVPQGLPGISGPEAVHSFHPGHSPTVYQTVLPLHHSSQHLEPLQPPPSTAQRYPKIDPPPHDMQPPSRAHGQAHHQAILAGAPMGSSSPTAPAVAGPAAPTQLRSPTTIAQSSSSSSTSKKSPLSLAAITSPYPDPSSSQPKNFRAQTLTLGERLRRGGMVARADPAGARAACLGLARGLRARSTRRVRPTARCFRRRSQLPAILVHPARLVVA